MKSSFLEIKYFETYYWANIIDNVLREPFSYDYLGSLGPFFGENIERFYEPFPEVSRLHDYIRYMIHTIHYEDLDSLDIDAFRNSRQKLWTEGAMEYHDLDFTPFDEWLEEKGKLRKDIDEDDVMEYQEELIMCGPYDELLEKMSDEVFFIVFLNRQLLYRFNQLIAKYVKEAVPLEREEADEKWFNRRGLVARQPIPMHVQRAVVHRDRGRCTSCHKDITGLISIGSIENFDHVIPLNEGGINDITNIQLLCQECNGKKAGKIEEPSKKYEKWY